MKKLIILKFLNIFSRRLLFGKNISIADHVIFAGNGTISIGNNTMIGIGTIIHTSTHDYNYHPMMSRRIDLPVKIGNNVWVGAGVIILPGIIIEDFAVIGAGSVVTANVPKGSIVAGNPCRIIKYRDPDIYESNLPFDKTQIKIVQGSFNNKYCK